MPARVVIAVVGCDCAVYSRRSDHADSNSKYQGERVHSKLGDA
jgi:hypothetical protein